MIKRFPYICLLSLFGSCNNGNQQSYHTDYTNSDSSGALPTYDIFSSPLYDTLSYDNVIESVKYVPLEANSKSLFSNRHLYAHKFGDKYIVTSDEYDRLKIGVFDSTGTFVTNGVTLGRGHFEIPLPYSFIVDEYNGFIILNGLNKILVFDISTLEIQAFDFKPFEDKTIYYLYPLASGSYVGLGVPDSNNEMDKKNYPYAYLLDSAFNVKTALRYSNKEKRHIIWSSSETPYGTTYERWKCSQKEDGVLFLQRFNDTIFTITGDFKQTPSFIIERGEDFRPSYKDQTINYLESLKKICFNDVFESDDYLFLTYKSDTSWHKTVVWSKLNANILCKSAENQAIPVSFDGFSGNVHVKQVQHGNTLITAIPANKLMNVLPGLKEDDNPVVVEIKLKDNYTPAQ